MRSALSLERIGKRVEWSNSAHDELSVEWSNSIKYAR